jgi:transcriptional antiterminator NusG
VNDELTTPQEDELTDALDVAGALEEDAAARLETAAVIAEAADEAEAEAIAEGSYAEAERIEEVADEAIEELVVEAAVEDAAAEEIEDAVEEAIVEEAVEEAIIEEIVEDTIIEEAIEEAVVEKAVVEKKAAKEAVVAIPEPEPGPDDPFRGPGDWYVVHTYAGYENKVKANLESRIHTMQMEDKIFRVHIPMEDVMEIKSGKKQVVQKKVFPGYLLVKMLYDNDSWYVVRNTPGVTGFVSAGTGSKPTPLSKREVEKILAVKAEEAKPQVRLGFDEGDVVRITSGPFADFNGTISEINADQAKLKVLVNIFDRETPVELSFDQVAKV